MNKSISGLAMILITYGTAHATGTTTEAHDTNYATKGTETVITGTVFTTVQAPPINVVFTPRTLLSQSVKQIAATAKVSGTTIGSEYVLGQLSASGDDANGYSTDNASSWITTEPSTVTKGSARAIVSDGTAFYVTIVHEATLPNPGATLLSLPLTEYKK